LGSIGITAKLAILGAIMVVSFVAILAVSTRNFARLTESMDQVQRVQGDFLKQIDDLQSECYKLQVYVLTRALDVFGGLKGVGSDSQGAIKALSTLAGMTVSSLQGAQGLLVSQAKMDLCIKATQDYIALLKGVPEAFDSGKNATIEFIGSTTTSFGMLNADLTGLILELRVAGNAASARAHAISRSTSLILSLVILGAILLCVGMTILLIRSITKPLSGLVAAVRRIGDGDLSATMDLAATDELGKIAASVDGLVVDLRSLIGTAKERLAILEDTGRGLASTMAETGAAVVQINSNIESTGRQLKGQSAAVMEVEAAIEMLSRSVDALGSMIEGQSSVITESSASVEQMIASVESAASNVSTAMEASTALVAEGREGKARIDDVDASVAAIVRYSESLGEAASLISAIADRTNILAMNAAIEAAHAGESGKGFAVVADEIRKLAEQSTSQSKDISADLGKVAAAIGNMREASEAAVGSFSSILGKSAALGDEVRALGSSMTEQREGGKHVLQGLARLREITGEIKIGSGEMSAGNKAILEQVQKLTRINSEVVNNNAEMMSGTAEINQAVSATIDLSSRNSEHIAELRLAMDRFRI